MAQKYKADKMFVKSYSAKGNKKQKNNNKKQQTKQIEFCLKGIGKKKT